MNHRLKLMTFQLLIKDSSYLLTPPHINWMHRSRIWWDAITFIIVIFMTILVGLKMRTSFIHRERYKDTIWRIRSPCSHFSLSDRWSYVRFPIEELLLNANSSFFFIIVKKKFQYIVIFLKQFSYFVLF